MRSTQEAPIRLLFPVALAAALLLAISPARAGEDSLPDSSSTAAPTSAEPAPAGPGSNCLGEPEPKLVMQHLLGIGYGPIGIEHQFRLGACIPLVRKPGILFDYTHVSGGIYIQTSPIYTMPGVYLVVAPLSILELRVEAAPVFYWPIGLNGAGYYPLDSYNSDYSPEQLPGPEGNEALGWYVRVGLALQGAIPMGPVKLLFKDSVTVERWQLGDGDYYFHNRHDIPAAGTEWFTTNNAVLLLDIPLHPNTSLRLGASDDLTANFGAGQISNSLQGMAMLHIARAGRVVRELTPAVLIGGRTHHPIRQGDLTFTIAVSLKLDLLAARKKTPTTASAALSH